MGETAKRGDELILVLNPGSTSTKLAVFEGDKCVYDGVVKHSELELGRFERIWDQYEYRKAAILEFLGDKGISLHSLTAVVGRGGLFRPTVSGTYGVNPKMIDDARGEGVQGEHASNLGAVLAYGIAWDYGIEAFIVDPPCVDELDAVARYSGIPEIRRNSLVHALNVKATARAVESPSASPHFRQMQKKGNKFVSTSMGYAPYLELIRSPRSAPNLPDFRNFFKRFFIYFCETGYPLVPMRKLNFSVNKLIR